MQPATVAIVEDLPSEPRERRSPQWQGRAFAGGSSTIATVGFKLLYCLVVLGHDRRQLLSFGITAHPTAAWLGCRRRPRPPWRCWPPAPAVHGLPSKTRR